MAWEQRKRGGLYYTRTVRVGERRYREYIGRGPMAEAVACQDEQARKDREAKRQAEKQKMAEWDALDGVAGGLCQVADRIMCEHLEAAGFHQHNRGE